MTKRKSFEFQYYENSSLWDPERYSGEPSDRAELAMDWIPPSVSSILDVGCGNGIFTNAIAIKEQVTGVDRSLAALQHVKTLCCQADITALPFSDRVFDLVVAMEILEHLPHSDFNNSLKELARVSRRFVMVTVPYKERLAMKHAICPKCDCRFHRFYHMRSFDSLRMRTIFNKLPDTMHLIRLEGVFAKEKIPIVSDMARRFRWRHIINFPSNSKCPQCGFRQAAVNPRKGLSPKNGFSADTLKKLEALVPIKKTTFKWWYALYEKVADGKE